MKKLWFVSKRYGWGWTPVTWQGWVITLLYIALMIGTALVLDPKQHSGSDALFAIVPLWLLYTFVLMLICYRTGEKPRWRWGD